MIGPILLADRGVVEVAGADATGFLHGLVTNDVQRLAPGEARYCALLAPQGKILFDFLLFATGEGESRRYLLDCPKALEADLVKRLNMYRLRSTVTIASLSDHLAVFAMTEASQTGSAALAVAPDPRAEALGFRAIAPREAIAAETARAEYDARRVAAGVPEGGVDFSYGEAFPHEANMDLLAGVDFKKGCFVGQEVVARTQHRGLARRRVTRYRAEGGAPEPGTPVKAGEIDLGVTGSRQGELGLAMIRLDRLEDALRAGVTPQAGGARLEFQKDG
ncbi:MAG TPA: folate-binding protein [Methylocystis sp.]|nr:folate-binding protein [Methylocystis sp.]